MDQAFVADQMWNPNDAFLLAWLQCTYLTTIQKYQLTLNTVYRNMNTKLGINSHLNTYQYINVMDSNRPRIIVTINVPAKS